MTPEMSIPSLSGDSGRASNLSVTLRRWFQAASLSPIIRAFLARFFSTRRASSPVTALFLFFITPLLFSGFVSEVIIRKHPPDVNRMSEYGHNGVYIRTLSPPVIIYIK
jgi:hypothetical protein